jgi:hypothetical protein
VWGFSVAGISCASCSTIPHYAFPSSFLHARVRNETITSPDPDCKLFPNNLDPRPLQALSSAEYLCQALIFFLGSVRASRGGFGRVSVGSWQDRCSGFSPRWYGTQGELANGERFASSPPTYSSLLSAWSKFLSD